MAEIKNHPYKKLPDKYNNDKCIPLDDKFCYKSSVYVDSYTKYYSVVNVEIFTQNDISIPIEKMSISRTFIDTFSPPQITIKVQVDDHFYGYLSKNDNLAGRSYIDSAGYSDNWEPVWTYQETLYNDVPVQYVHVLAWNANGSKDENYGARMWISLNKQFYKFPNGKQYIDTVNNWQYFKLSPTTFGRDYIPYEQINRRGSQTSYGPGTVWLPNTVWGPVYISMPVYLNESSAEL